MMKFTTPLIALGLSSTLFAEEAKPLTVPNNFQNALNHIDTDGEYLSLNNIEGDLNEVTKALDLLFLSQMQVSTPEIAKNFSFKSLLSLTALDKATAVGISSKPHGDAHLNKVFIDTRGNTDGILSFIGNTAQAWQAAHYAPEDTDLILETTLDLQKAPALYRQLVQLLPDDAHAESLEVLDESLFGEGALSNAELMERTTLRISAAIRIDNSKMWTMEGGIQLPAVDGCIRIDGIAKTIWPLLKKELATQFDIQSEGSIDTILSPIQVPCPWGAQQALAVIDLDKDTLWISLSQEFLNEARSSGKKLKDSLEYRRTCQALPQSGATHAYLSPQVQSELFKAYSEEIGNREQSVHLRPFFNTYFSSEMRPQGYAWSMRHDDKGLLMVSNSPFANKGGSTMSHVAAITGLAAMAYGPIQKQVEQANQVKTINNIKQLYAGCLTHAMDHDGSLPASLEDLNEGNYVDDLEGLMSTLDGEVQYVSGLNTSGLVKSIVLYTPMSPDGTRIIARLNGSVTEVTEEEFQKAMKSQTK